MCKVSLKSIVAIWAKGPLSDDGEPIAQFSLGLGVTFKADGDLDPFKLVVGQMKATSPTGSANLPGMTWEGGDALEQWMQVDGTWYRFDDVKDEWVKVKKIKVPEAAYSYDMYVQDYPGEFVSEGQKVNYAFRQQGSVRKISKDENLITQAEVMTGTITGTYPDLSWNLPTNDC